MTVFNKLPQRLLIGATVVFALLGLLMTVQAQDGTLPLPGRDSSTPYQTLSSSEPGFGRDVKLDGEWLATSTFDRQILIYRRDANGQYMPHSSIQVETIWRYAELPSFDLENNRLFVVMRSHDSANPLLQIYEPDSSGVWTVIKSFDGIGGLTDADSSGRQFIAGEEIWRETPNGDWEMSTGRFGVHMLQKISGDYMTATYHGEHMSYVGPVYMYQYNSGNSPQWGSEVSFSAHIGGPFGLHTEVEGSTAFITGDHRYMAPRETNLGYVRVLNLINGQWQEGQQIIPHDVPGDPANAFGYSVEMDGDYLIISSPSDEPNQSALYLYQRNGLNWHFYDKFNLPGRGYQFFEYGDTDLEAGYVAVGDLGYSFDNMGNESFAPKIYIFSYDDVPTSPATPEVTPDVTPEVPQ